MVRNNDIEKQIIKLKNRINELNKKYYDLNKSDVSDMEYDSLMQDLIELEEKYPEFKSEDSPTKKVSGYINEKFKKHKHSLPMLSLSNVFNIDELMKFNERIEKETKKVNINYFCEYKIDGVSISLEYNNGKLLKAITRGDGEYGEDVTKNVKIIDSIPKEIKSKDNLIVRGEIFITKEQFNKLNNNRKKSNKKLFANARNMASGTLRQLNSKIIKERNLNAFFYFVNINNNSEYFDTYKQSIEFLKNNNFPINEKYNKLCLSIIEVVNYINKMSNDRYLLNYDTDGIVIKVNNVKLHKTIGWTSKFPKWATAYKFLAVRSVTILEDIIPTVGRTGKITYNAKLKPVELIGTIVKAASLHNAEYIQKKDIRIGDHVLIKKAGDIIPKIIEPIIEKRQSNTKKWEIITKCPECQEILQRKGNSVDQFCVNESCFKRKIRLIEHFVSKNGMNIQGLNKKILHKLYKLEFINSFSSIYKLNDYHDEIIKVDKFGEKSFNNLINSIEKSKKVSLNKFIFALGIENVGEYISTILMKKYKTIEKIIKVNLHELSLIPEIGDVIAKSIFNYFKNKYNVNEIKELIKLGIDIYCDVKKGILDNLVFTITGSLSNSRNYYKNLIKDLGGNITSSITKKTNYLLCGKEPGTKLKKAKNLNIKIISEDEFKNILKG